MGVVLELFPLVAFLVAYYVRDLYFATGALMVAMPLLLVADWLLTRRLPPMHLLSTALVLLFGTATLLLRNALYIQWKPTIFLWIVAVAFLVSGFVGRKPLVQRFLQPTLDAEGTLPVTLWRRLNWAWVVFYALLGGANLLVARNASMNVWVSFKVFGLSAAILLFLIAQALWINSRGAAPRQQEPHA